jgi:hypothetical protein
MLYTIYKVTNTINGKIYIGKHQTENPNDAYFGSGKFIKSAIRKYGKENFVKEVMFVFETELEMNQKEKELITEEFVSRKDTYNAGVGGEGGPHFKGRNHSLELKERFSTDEFKSKVSKGVRNFYDNGGQNWNKNKKMSDAQKEKISRTMKGRKLPEETKEKIKEARQKQIFDEETRKKMSESAKNRKKKNSGPLS